MEPGGQRFLYTGNSSDGPTLSECTQSTGLGRLVHMAALCRSMDQQILQVIVTLVLNLLNGDKK